MAKLRDAQGRSSHKRICGKGVVVRRERFMANQTFGIKLSDVSMSILPSMIIDHTMCAIFVVGSNSSSFS